MKKIKKCIKFHILNISIHLYKMYRNVKNLKYYKNINFLLFYIYKKKIEIYKKSIK